MSIYKFSAQLTCTSVKNMVVYRKKRNIQSQLIISSGSNDPFVLGGRNDRHSGI